MRFDPKRVLFYVSRHGQTGPYDEKLTGPTNPPLNAQGHQSAYDLANFFQPLPLASIVTSGMTRAVETSMIVGEAKSLQPHIEKGVDSWNMGHIPNLPAEPPPSLINHYVEHPNEKIPGGESLNQFRRRVHPVFGQAIQAYQKLRIPSLISAHDSVIREAGAVFNNNLESALVKPGGAIAVMRHKSGAIRAVPVFKPDFTVRTKDSK